MINFKIESSLEDFLIFYFTQVFLNSGTSLYKDKLEVLRTFDINKSESDYFTIKDEDLIKIFNTENYIKNFKEIYKNLDTFYTEINKNILESLEKDVNLHLNKYIEYLNKIFGDNKNIKNIKIAAIKSYSKSEAAFTKRIIPDKLFLLIKEKDHLEMSEIDFLQKYRAIIFHEVTHLYFYTHELFQSSIKNIWIKDYKNKIKPANYRMPLEETLVTFLVNQKYSYVQEILDIGLSESLMFEAIEKDKNIKEVYNFLQKVTSDNIADCLEILVSNLFKNNFFKS